MSTVWPLVAPATSDDVISDGFKEILVAAIDNVKQSIAIADEVVLASHGKPKVAYDTDKSRRTARIYASAYIAIYGFWESTIDDLMRFGVEFYLKQSDVTVLTKELKILMREKKGDPLELCGDGWKNVARKAVESIIDAPATKYSLCTLQELVFSRYGGILNDTTCTFFSSTANVITWIQQVPGLKPDPTLVASSPNAALKKSFDEEQKKSSTENGVTKNLKIVGIATTSIDHALRYRFEFCLQIRHHLAHSGKLPIDNNLNRAETLTKFFGDTITSIFQKILAENETKFST
jgi:hypothetical protein